MKKLILMSLLGLSVLNADMSDLFNSEKVELTMTAYKAEIDFKVQKYLFENRLVFLQEADKFMSENNASVDEEIEKRFKERTGVRELSRIIRNIRKDRKEYLKMLIEEAIKGITDKKQKRTTTKAVKAEEEKKIKEIAAKILKLKIKNEIREELATKKAETLRKNLEEEYRVEIEKKLREK